MDGMETGWEERESEQEILESFPQKYQGPIVTAARNNRNIVRRWHWTNTKGSRECAGHRVV